MTEEAVLWRVSPSLYYATVTKVWDRTLARDGPAPANDTDVKLVSLRTPDVSEVSNCCRA